METAEEFLKNYTPTNDDRYDWYSPEQCIEAMIDFAKGHVEEALKMAALTSESSDANRWEIQTCYKTENIK